MIARGQQLSLIAIKRCLLRGLVLPAFYVGSAMAADMPVKAPPVTAAPAPYNWTGFYLGLNAGGAWGYSGDPLTTVACSPATFASTYICTTSAADAAALAAAGTGSMSASGFTGGVQGGYNLQSNNAVYGVELDFESLHLRPSRSVSGTYPVGGIGISSPFTINESASTDWLFTARGRLGWAFNTLLVYATGGVAVTDLKASNSYTDPTPAAGTWAASATKAGWTVGSGVEWAFSKTWTAKIEYLYVDFGSVTANGTITPGPGYAQAISTKTDLTAQIARAGINHKF